MNTPSVQSLVSKYLSPIKGTRGELKEVNSRAGTGKVYMRLEHLVMSENMELLKKEVGGCQKVTGARGALNISSKL